MLKPSTIAFLFLLGLLPPAAQAAELRAGLGLFAFAPQGMDLHLSLRPGHGRWSYGLRYVRWMDTFSDPFTGNDLTETTNSYAGLTVDYSYAPDAAFTWYLSGAVYTVTKSEHSLLTLETGEDEATAPFVGGGFSGRFAGRFYYDLGILLAPGAELATSTSVSSEEDSGLFDVRLIVGFSF